MITIKTFILNPFQENTYILSDDSGESIIIDPGCYSETEKNEIDNYFKTKNLRCTKMVFTHGHVDHILGSAHVAIKYKPEILIHKNDAFLLNEAQKHGIIFGFNVEQPPMPTKYLVENDEIYFGNSYLKVLQVPGHSPGSIALFSEKQKFVIVGDVLFKGSIGRTDLPQGDYDQLMNSIFNKLMVLPPDTIVYPGHGPSTSIHEEAISNPFLG
jgi:hydroxyacylglutathione hydrolase